MSISWFIEWILFECSFCECKKWMKIDQSNVLWYILPTDTALSQMEDLWINQFIACCFPLELSITLRILNLDHKLCELRIETPWNAIELTNETRKFRIVTFSKKSKCSLNFRLILFSICLKLTWKKIPETPIELDSPLNAYS